MHFLYALRKTVSRKGTQSQRPHGLHRWTGHQEVLLSSKRKSAFPLTRHFISVIFPVIYDAKAISDNFINSILLKAGLLQVGFFISFLPCRYFTTTGKLSENKKRIAQRQFFKSYRHQPIFPVRRQTSIFGTCELNFCVRYGNRWTLAVIDTYYEIGDPYGNRTHVCGVRGRRLNRLTNGPGCISRLAP